MLLGSRHIGLAQVEAATVWHCVDHARKQSPSDRGPYSPAEAQAREAHAGLWQDAAQVPRCELLKLKRGARNDLRPFLHLRRSRALVPWIHFQSMTCGFQWENQ